jgi:hypothetical protein
MKLHYPWGVPKPGIDAVWRCEAKQYSTIIDADLEQYGRTPPRLEMTWHHVERRTPKGAIVSGQFHLLSAKRAKFRNTPGEALESFKARRKRQIDILNAQLVRARSELALTNEVDLLT